MITALEAKHIHSSSSAPPEAGEAEAEAAAAVASTLVFLLPSQAQRKWWSQPPPGSDLKSRRLQRLVARTTLGVSARIPFPSSYT